MKYSPPFSVSRVAASRTHMQGWVVWDALNNRCADVDGTWLWASKRDALAFAKELTERARELGPNED